jgi:putative component of toxin-antitoxin plasmid stabilization module
VYYNALFDHEAQISKRLANIEEHGHFGTAKDLGEFLSELKWGNGRRVYYSVLEDGHRKF